MSLVLLQNFKTVFLDLFVSRVPIQTFRDQSNRYRAGVHVHKVHRGTQPLDRKSSYRSMQYEVNKEKNPEPLQLV